MSKITIPREISPLLAEEIGLHIGDGSMNIYKNKYRIKGKYSLRGHKEDDKDHYDKRVKEIYKKVFNIDISLHLNEKTGVYGFQIWSDELIEYKNKILDIPLGKKKEIKIPEIILLKREHQIAVLRGIFDTDGCLYLEPKREKLYPRVKFATTSKRLGT
ncbi:MAG: LAGLIDADG family homing endonuclease [Nanoarchaeota archaeon]|nr:LAGLIDADG family homing endonuclease [Nanoarchaeota archaeon]